MKNEGRGGVKLPSKEPLLSLFLCQRIFYLKDFACHSFAAY